MYSGSWDMKSSYKKIGSFVKQVNVHNKDLSVTNLQGINMNKSFMPSVANTNGTPHWCSVK